MQISFKLTKRLSIWELVEYLSGSFIVSSSFSLVDTLWLLETASRERSGYYTFQTTINYFIRAIPNLVVEKQVFGRN